MSEHSIDDASGLETARTSEQPTDDKGGDAIEAATGGAVSGAAEDVDRPYPEDGSVADPIA